MIGPDGRMNEAAGELAGLTQDEAEERILAWIRERGLLVERKAYRHTITLCERCKSRIEPLISLQWWCRMDELKQPALAALRDDRVRYHPPSQHRYAIESLESAPDWNISRQIWWGHQLPVWECPDGHVTVEETEPAACAECGSTELTRSQDVLDTWFSSALWPFAILGWPEETPELEAWYPGTLNTTAREIIRLWENRMIFSGLELMGEVPFRDVVIHTTVLASDGRRMSKSLGNGVDPLELIDRHGADSTRYGLLKLSSTQDARFSEGAVEEGRKLANKLWNVSRLILANVGDAHAEQRPQALEERWIAWRLDRAQRELEEHLAAFDFSPATSVLYRVTFDDFCDWYAEAIKPRLYDGDGDAQSTALANLERLLKLLHPAMPHVTEEIWSNLPDRETRLIVAPWPEPVGADAGAELEFEPVRTAAEVFRRAGVRPPSRASSSGSSRRSSSPIGSRPTAATSRPRSSACAARSPAPRACWPTSASSAMPPRRWSRRSARSWSDTVASSMRSAVDWLESLSPWPEEFGLGRMRALLAELGEPQRAYPAIHVVGTNGKSTATRRAAAFLGREGVLAGAYTSPHVAGWSERVQVDGRDADLEQALERVRPAAVRLGATQFEVLTAAALAEFAEAEVEVAVVEAGLGGRLDATNVLAAPVVALTNVSLDHTDVLGETREAIAAEKLAVVAPGSTVVLGEPEWEQAARANGAAVVVHAEDVGRAAAEAFLGRPLDGDVEFHLPGRFEQVGEDVFAGAHNPAGVEWLLERLPRRDYVVVASILARQGHRRDAELAGGGRARSRRHLLPQQPRASRRGARPASGAVLRHRGARRRPGRCTRARTRARRRRGRRSGDRFALPSRRPHRPTTTRTMGQFGERLSVFAVAVIVVLTIVGLAFGVGYLVGKLLL